MENIILIGSSGHAKVIIDMVEKQGAYKIVGLIDAFRPVGEETLGYKIIGAEDDLPILVGQYDLKGFIVAIGDNSIRATVAANVACCCPGLPPVTAIHPNSSIGKGATVAEGSVIMAGAVINPCCQIGRFCIVNTAASLDHDSVMEDFSSLAPGASTGGNCRIGHHSAVSIGATLRHGIKVGAHSVVGAGSLLMTDLGDYSIAYGVPATKIRDRKPGEKYL